MHPVDLTVTELGVFLGTNEPACPERHGEM
jgi:hypothetical protein